MNLRRLYILLFTKILLFNFAFSQSYNDTIHVDSLSSNQFTKIKERPLSYIKHDDSTVFLLKMFSQGRFVTGLSDKSKQGYQLFLRSSTQKDSICQSIRLIEVTEQSDREELSFAIVLDYSGSMGWAYKDMQVQAQAFIESLTGASFSRINFDDQIDLIHQTPVKKPKSVTKDQFYKYGGMTALNKAIVDGVKSLKDVPKNKFVIVFTDGLENASAMNANSVITIAQKHNTPVYGISFGVAPVAQRLRDICQYTNGKFYSINDLESLKGQFESISHGQFGRYYKVVSACDDSITYDRLVIKSPSGDSTVVRLANEYQKAPDFKDPIYFNTFQFKASSSGLNTRERARVKNTADQIIAYLIDHPNDKVIIEGHASPDGEEDSNWLLSHDRAYAVEKIIRNILKTEYKGDPEVMQAMKRIDIDYHGPTKPIFPVDSRSNEENRRVNILIISGK